MACCQQICPATLPGYALGQIQQKHIGSKKHPHFFFKKSFRSPCLLDEGTAWRQSQAALHCFCAVTGGPALLFFARVTRFDPSSKHWCQRHELCSVSVHRSCRVHHEIWHQARCARPGLLLLHLGCSPSRFQLRVGLSLPLSHAS